MTALDAIPTVIDFIKLVYIIPNCFRSILMCDKQIKLYGGGEKINGNGIARIDPDSSTLDVDNNTWMI